MKGTYVMAGMSGIFALLIVGVFSLSLADHYALRSSSLAAVISAALTDFTNSDRNTHGLQELAVSPVLTAAAQAKADDMAAHGYFAHVSPDGKDSWYWFKQAGYSFSYAGENLAVDFSDSSNVEQAWMNSPTHRANILDGHFTQIGIATAAGTYEGRPTTFVVEMFGTPAVTDKFTDIRTTASPENPAEPALATAAASPTQKTPKIASSAPAAPEIPPVLGASAVSAPAHAAPVTPWWARLLASPKTALAYAYDALAALVLILLAFVTGLEFKRHHLPHVAAAVSLLLLMAVLFGLASAVFFSTPVLAAPEISAAA